VVKKAIENMRHAPDFWFEILFVKISVALTMPLLNVPEVEFDNVVVKPIVTFRTLRIFFVYRHTSINEQSEHKQTRVEAYTREASLGSVVFDERNPIVSLESSCVRSIHAESLLACSDLTGSVNAADCSSLPSMIA
jgi:hypothetical protein